jgi:hypothetical protein
MNITHIATDKEYLDRIASKYTYKVESDDNITICYGKLPFGENYFKWREIRKVAENNDEYKVAIITYHDGPPQLIMFRYDIPHLSFYLRKE